MNNSFLLVLLSVLLHLVNNNPQIKTRKAEPIDLCHAFNELNTKIRDGAIDKKTAAATVKELLSKIKPLYYSKGGKNFAKAEWIFPLQVYTAKAIGGTNGNGYIASRYNYFDGNKHSGHPAYDIFIHDKNQDGIDDVTKKPVNVVSVTGGLVIAIENTWDSTSQLRGGKYILIYDPSTGIFTYYAHNNILLVNLGDLVKPGDIIATVGRTGYNAFKKRSPTHLHVMQLKLDGNYYPAPLQFYPDLVKMKTVK